MTCGESSEAAWRSSGSEAAAARRGSSVAKQRSSSSVAKQQQRGSSSAAAAAWQQEPGASTRSQQEHEEPGGARGASGARGATRSQQEPGAGGGARRRRRRRHQTRSIESFLQPKTPSQSLVVVALWQAWPGNLPDGLDKHDRCVYSSYQSNRERYPGDSEDVKHNCITARLTKHLAIFQDEKHSGLSSEV